jgi:uncharacterized protein (DUF4415 family)
MADQTGKTSQDFTAAASSSTEQVLVPIDKDLVDWFRTQGNVVLQINDLCRFYMDTSVTRDLEFAEEFEKMQQDPNEPPTL